MNPNALVVFMKAPVPGQCKTRLAAAVGAEEAARLYRAFCADILAAASGAPGALGRPLARHAPSYNPGRPLARYDLWIAYQAHPDFSSPEWAGKHPYFPQAHGDLGARLIDAFESLFSKGYARVAAIGTDAPSLPPERIAEAFDVLREKDAVFGPAEDGGYYLAGLRRRLPEIFSGIPWSTKDVMAATRAALAAVDASTQELAPHYDVDSVEDLRRLARELVGPAAALCPRTRSVLTSLPIPAEPPPPGARPGPA